MTMTAREISEYLLERTGSAMLERDFEKFMSCFAIPHELHTFNDVQILETLEDMRAVYDEVLSFYSRANVTDLARRCMAADFRDENTVAAVHESRMLSGARLVKEPHTVFSVIERFGEDWKLVRSEYAITDSPVLTAALETGAKKRPK